MTDESAGTAPGPRPAGPYTPALRVGGWLICSGQLGVRDGTLAEGLSAQVTQAVANVQALVAAEGATLANVVKTTVFLTDIGDYAAMNEAYVAAFGDHRPARSAIAVAGLPLGGLVEIEAWAWIGV